MNKIFALFILIGFLLPGFAFSQFNTPENMNETKEIVEKGIDVGISELPGKIAIIFKEDVLPVWKKMYEWFYARLGYRIVDWFEANIEPEIEKRKPNLEEEFEKEKQEIKNDAPNIGKSLWEKFKEIIK